MVKLLNEVGLNLASSAEVESAKAIKEQLSFVSMDPNAEKEKFISSTSQHRTFKLPDESIVTVGSQQWRCPEALFNPMLIGKEMPSLHDLVVMSNKKCDLDVRKVLYENIILSGGTTMFRNITERLQKELQSHK